MVIESSVNWIKIIINDQFLKNYLEDENKIIIYLIK